MRKLLYFIGLFILISCSCQKSAEPQEYDWEGLRDTLGLDSTAIFVKEVSPLYKDKYLYCSDSGVMLKTMFYEVRYDEDDQRLDTILWWVTRENGIVYAASNRQHSTVEHYSWSDDVWESIQWCIKNREKCYSY